MINMAQGFDKGQFGKSMHQFEAITTSDQAPPEELELPWTLAKQEMQMLTLHDTILNVFITILCHTVGKAGHMDFSQIVNKRNWLDCRTLRAHYVLLYLIGQNICTSCCPALQVG